MKYFTLTITFALFILGLSAQITYGVKPNRANPDRDWTTQHKQEDRFSVHVKAGGNLSGVFWQESIGAGNVKVRPNPGLHAGMAVSVPVYIIHKHFALQSGVFFTQKGFRQYYEDGMFGKGTLIVSPRYIELPVNVLFKGDEYTPARLYFGAGGYIAHGINGGNWSIEYKGGRDAGSIEFVDISDQNDHDDRFNYGKKIDIGISVILGYEITPNIGFELAGQRGLKNIAPTRAGNMTFERFYNAGLMLSAIFTLQ
ncbi:MAG: outer membrane beta-barrel protein [Niabella sp.]